MPRRHLPEYKYTVEEKLQAISRICQGESEDVLVREWGISKQTLRRWMKNQNKLQMEYFDGTLNQKRTSYTVEQKLEIVRLVREGCQQTMLAREVGLPESTLRGWLREEEKLRTILQRINNTASTAAVSDSDSDHGVNKIGSRKCTETSGEQAQFVFNESEPNKTERLQATGIKLEPPSDWVGKGVGMMQNTNVKEEPVNGKTYEDEKSVESMNRPHASIVAPKTSVAPTGIETATVKVENFGNMPEFPTQNQHPVCLPEPPSDQSRVCGPRAEIPVDFEEADFEIGTLLLEYYLDNSNPDCPVSDDELKLQAWYLNRALDRPADFECSEDWLQRWRKCFCPESPQDIEVPEGSYLEEEDLDEIQSQVQKYSSVILIRTEKLALGLCFPLYCMLNGLCFYMGTIYFSRRRCTLCFDHSVGIYLNRPCHHNSIFKFT